MNYEQKYKEALKKAKRCYKDLSNLNSMIATMSKDFFEECFPELKESDDEKIRKYLMDYVKSAGIGNSIFDSINTREDILFWLKKQGEQVNQYLYDIIIALWDLLDKIDTFADLQIDDTDPDNPFRKIEDITRERHEFVKSDGYNLYIKGEKITDFQEQNTMMFNSTEESKCEENDNSTACLEKQDEQKPEPKFEVGDWVVLAGEVAQILDIQENYAVFRDTNGKNFLSNHAFHLWTIQDAKDGDVLVFDDIIMIFKNIKTVCTANTYFSYCDGIAVDDWCDFGPDAHPATKEQRDLLYSKMKDAGYEWDAEKKELKKIEQNTTWSEEDERIYYGLFSDIRIKQNCSNNLLKEYYNKQLNWLKSLKPQQNQYDKGFNDGYSAAKYNQWKPSEEQLRVLQTAIKDYGICAEKNIFESLYNDLKNL